MNKEELINLLHDYVRETLDEKERRRIEQELKKDPELTIELERVVAYYAALNTIPAYTAGADFLQKVQVRINRPGFFRRLGRMLFFPLSIKLPIEALGLVAASVLVVMIYKPDVPRKDSVPENSILYTADLSDARQENVPASAVESEILAGEAVPLRQKSSAYGSGRGGAKSGSNDYSSSFESGASKPVATASASHEESSVTSFSAEMDSDTSTPVMAADEQYHQDSAVLGAKAGNTRDGHELIVAAAAAGGSANSKPAEQLEPEAAIPEPPFAPAQLAWTWSPDEEGNRKRLLQKSLMPETSAASEQTAKVPPSETVHESKESLPIERSLQSIAATARGICSIVPGKEPGASVFVVRIPFENIEELKALLEKRGVLNTAGSAFRGGTDTLTIFITVPHD